MIEQTHMNADNSFQPRIPLAGPALKACSAFAAGILGASILRFDAAITASALIFGTIFLLITRNRHWAGNFSATLVMVFAGLFARSIQLETTQPAVIPLELVNQRVLLEGTVTGAVRFNNGNTRFTVKCRSLKHKGGRYILHGRMSCMLFDREIALTEGTRLSLRGRIFKVLKPFEINAIPFTYRHNPSQTPFRFVVDNDIKSLMILERHIPFFSVIRTIFTGLLERHSFGGHGELLRAFLFGDRTHIPSETVRWFTASGTAHLLAVSGLNVGIVIVSANWILGLLGLSRNVRVIITLCISTFYAGICTFNPPVARALIMAGLAYCGLLIGRLKHLENFFFATLLAIIVLDPESLFGSSLQLSFAAVWAIITFYQPVMTFLRARLFRTHFRHQVFDYVISIIVLTVLASIATTPIIAWHFGPVSLVAVLTNIPAVPLASVIVILGMFSIPLIAFEPFTAPLSLFITSMTGLCLKLLVSLASFFASVPYATFEITSLTVFSIVLFFAWLFVLSRAQGRSNLKKALIYIPLFYLIVTTYNPLFSSVLGVKKPERVIFFDVGDGESALVEYNDRRFLVDTGVAYAARVSVLPSLEAMGITALDGVFISHLDTDHSGGLGEIIKKVKVKQIYCNNAVRDSLVQRYGDKVTALAAGDSLTLKDGGIFVLSPPKDERMFEKSGIKSDNNLSLVLRFTLSGETVLFTGDCESGVQKLLTLWGSMLKSDVLKVPHHGAKDLDSLFVEAVNPRSAVISCALNTRFGHPDKAVLTLLEQSGIFVRRTDIEGPVSFTFPITVKSKR